MKDSVLNIPKESLEKNSSVEILRRGQIIVISQELESKPGSSNSKDEITEAHGTIAAAALNAGLQIIGDITLNPPGDLLFSKVVILDLVVAIAPEGMDLNAIEETNISPQTKFPAVFNEYCATKEIHSEWAERFTHEDAQQILVFAESSYKKFDSNVNINISATRLESAYLFRCMATRTKL